MNRLTKNLGIALVVSVVLNVFFLGFSAARYVRHGDGHPPSFESDADGSISMRSLWKRHAASLGARHEAIDSARQSVREALIAEPFQAPALERALASLRKETDETQVMLHRALVESAADMSLEERRRLADSRWVMGAGPRGAPHHR